MRTAIHKQTYRGQGIYWHGGNNYGDETLILGHSMAAVRALDAGIFRLTGVAAEAVAHRDDAASEVCIGLHDAQDRVVCRADLDEVAGLEPGPGESLTGRGELGIPDFARVVLDPAGLGIDLATWAGSLLRARLPSTCGRGCGCCGIARSRACCGPARP